MVAFGSIAFGFSALEIVLDYFFPNEQPPHRNTEYQEEMGNKEGATVAGLPGSGFSL